ncbi:MAG: GGDEF domain-containing protein [Spirochaetales bacterium]|nr:GGDEF domain-containing protein [Spirochaetales bacterium]
MRKAIVIIYAIMSIFIFLALFLILAFNFFTLYEKNYPRVKNNFAYLQQKIINWQKKHPDFTTAGLKAYLDEECRQNENMLTYAIYTKNNGILLIDGVYFYYSKKPKIASTYFKGESLLQIYWKGSPQYQEEFFGMEILTTKFLLQDDYYFESLVSIITTQEIYDSLKWGFLAIAVWIILAITIRLFLAARPDPNPYPAMDEIQPFQQEHFSTHASTEENRQDFRQIDGDSTAADNKDSGSQESSKLFSPRSGLGWEENLASRIKFELKRTASFDQDMVLALIRLDNPQYLQNPDILFAEIAKIIKELFQFQDLTFEYGKYGYALVLTDMNLNGSIELMKSFQRRIAREKFKDGKVTLSIGLSARNGRLMGEQTLLQESQAALDRAMKEGENRIVAFKPDPDKYRDFIAKKI